MPTDSGFAFSPKRLTNLKFPYLRLSETVLGLVEDIFCTNMTSVAMNH